MNTMMNEQKASAYLGLSLRTLQRLRKKKTGPSYHQFGRRIGYIYQDLEAYMRQHRYGQDFDTHDYDYDDGENTSLSDNSYIH